MSLIFNSCTCLSHQLRIAGGCGCSFIPDGFVSVGKEEEDKEVNRSGDPLRAKTGGFATEKRVLQSKSKAKVKAEVTTPKVGRKKPKVGKKPKK